MMQVGPRSTKWISQAQVSITANKNDSLPSILTSCDESSTNIDEVIPDDDTADNEDMIYNTTDEARLSDDDMLLFNEEDESLMHTFLKDSKSAKVVLANTIYEKSVTRGLGLMRPMQNPHMSNPPPKGFNIGPCFCGRSGCQDCYNYQEQFRSKENPRKMIGGWTDTRCH